MAITGGQRPLARFAGSRLAPLLNQSSLLRALSRPVQRFRPILSLGGRVIVTRHADVVEVLRRDDDFTVAEVNGAAMDRVNGPFVLGMDRTEQYLREKHILQQALRPDDIDRMGAFVRQTATALVEAAEPSGTIDVVQGLARPVAVRMVATFFGIAGPDEATMLRWMRTIFHETFLNVGGDPGVRRKGERSAAELHSFTDELIAARQQAIAGGAPVFDDFLTRLVRFQRDPELCLSDEGIRRNLGGVVVGAVETTAKAVASAVDELLRRPAALESAGEAAAAGDIDAVRAHVLEALRFSPLNPVLSRHAARASVLAAGTRREHQVPAGRQVYAAILPAMFDPSVVDDPESFRTDRPASAYLHFGHGLHACFGERINLVQLPEVVGALIAGHQVNRAPGRAGRLVYDGPFPDRLVVELVRRPATGP